MLLTFLNQKRLGKRPGQNQANSVDVCAKSLSMSQRFYAIKGIHFVREENYYDTFWCFLCFFKHTTIILLRHSFCWSIRLEI